MTNNNIIFIQGGAYAEIKKALKQWIDLYSDQLQGDLNFNLYKNGKGKHIIQADERLDNECFFYLVNYLKYPENINYTIAVEGFTTGEDNKLKSKKLLVYMAPNDKDYDNVFVVTSDNINYKVDFGGKITEIADHKIYVIPQEALLSAPEILKIQKKVSKKDGGKEAEIKISKRFKILLILTATYLLGSILFYLISKDDPVFQKMTYFLGFGIWSWFFFDYEMLRIKKYYLQSLLIAFTFSIFGILVFNYFKNKADVWVFIGTMSPLTFLISQKPIRILYLILLKREPKIDKNGNFADSLYTLFLFLCSILLPMIIYTNFK